MQLDSTAVIEAVSQVILNHIEALRNSQLQYDQTLIELRLLTLAIAVGAATLGGRVRREWKTGIGAALLLGFIVLMPFLYDLYAVDAQGRRGGLVDELDSTLIHLSGLTTEEQSRYRFQNRDALLEVNGGTWSQRWAHRLEQFECHSLPTLWYGGCYVVGLVLLFGRWFLFESDQPKDALDQAQQPLPQVPPKKPPKKKR